MLATCMNQWGSPDKIILPSKIIDGRIVGRINYEWYGKYVNAYIDICPLGLTVLRKITISQKAGVTGRVDWFEKKKKLNQVNTRWVRPFHVLTEIKLRLKKFCFCH